VLRESGSHTYERADGAPAVAGRFKLASLVQYVPLPVRSAAMICTQAADEAVHCLQLRA